jgi:hypothetical protein
LGRLPSAILQPGVAMLKAMIGKWRRQKTQKLQLFGVSIQHRRFFLNSQLFYSQGCEYPSVVVRHGFIFLVSIIGFIIFQYFGQYIAIFWKKLSLGLL